MADEIETGASPAESAIVETPNAGSSVDAALDAAFDATFGDDDDSPVRERDEFGRFKAKEEGPRAEPVENTKETPQNQPVEPEKGPEPVVEIPDEFAAPPPWLNTAKDEWSKAPKPLREAMAQRFSEMERGIAQYRETLAPYQGFLEAAKASNVDPVAMVNRYVEIDRAFAANPAAGFEMIANAFGTDMRTIAAHFLGQQPPEKDAQVAALQRENAALRQKAQQFDAYMTREQQRTQTQVEQTVTEFFSNAEKYPRANELAEDIAWIISTKGAKDLDAAYRKACNINPLPSGARTAEAGDPATARTGANPKTTLSISGSPSAGSNPANVPKSASVRDSIDYAFSKAGVG